MVEVSVQSKVDVMVEVKGGKKMFFFFIRGAFNALFK